MTTRTRGRQVVAGVLTSVLAGIALAACGVTPDSGPNVIPKSQVPFHLETPVAPTTTTTTIAPSEFTIPVQVYFVSSTRQDLVASERSLPQPGSLTQVLEALLAGPAPIETDKNVSTALGSSVRLLGATVSNGVATVNFNQAFSQISGTDAVLAVAQVVFTVTGVLGADTGVQFEIAGAPVQVPNASGVQVSGPVYVLQYVSLRPGATPSTATVGATSTTTTAPAPTTTTTTAPTPPAPTTPPT